MRLLPVLMYSCPILLTPILCLQWVCSMRNDHAQPDYCLEALAVNNGGARLVVLLLRDPHLLESRQRSQDGAADPNRVLAFWRGNNLNLHGGRSQRRDFLLHAVSDSGYMVVPPDSTVLAYRSLRMSTSHFMIEL